jgi:type IV pilus assembly protein PilV
VRGFTLIEALVALLALSIGLLGMAGLQLTGLRSNLSSAFRSQATYLANDITDRIRANLSPNKLNIANYATGLGAPPTPGGVAETDLAAWKAGLAATLPQGDGTVVVNLVGSQVTVTVQWDDSKGAAAPIVFTTVTRL